MLLIPAEDELVMCAPGQLPVRTRKLGPSSRPVVTPRGVADDVLGQSGFMDLAKLVSGGGQQKYDAYKDLAYKIGASIMQMGSNDFELQTMRPSLPHPALDSPLWTQGKRCTWTFKAGICS